MQDTTKRSVLYKSSGGKGWDCFIEARKAPVFNACGSAVCDVANDVDRTVDSTKVKRLKGMSH